MKKKKLLLLGIIVVFVTISCKNQKQVFFYHGDVIVSGEIIKWKDSDGSKTISLICNDVASGDQLYFVEKIQSDGTFKFKFEKYNTQDIWLDYDNEMKTLFVYPGDSVYVRFHKDGFSCNDDFSGDAEKANRDIQAFLKEFNSFQKDDIQMRINELSPIEYKRLVYNQQKQYDSLLIAFVKEKKPSKEIELWANAYLDYRCGFDLFTPMLSGKDLPEEYWDFIHDYHVDNRNAVICSKYLAYLEMYNAYLALVQNKSKQIMELYAQKRYLQMLEAYTDLLLDIATGAAFDIMLTQTYYSIAGEDYTVVNSLLTRYDSLVHNKVLRNRLHEELLRLELTENSKSLTFHSNLSDFQNEDLIEELFSHIISKYKGKVLYVDFWAPWCSPCMQEIPYSQILHKDYKDKQVVFVYLCSRSSSEKWKSTINEKNIEGEHYYLSNDQYDVLQSQFQIQGIPWYLLINEKGDVVNANAPRPSSNEIRLALDELLTTISL